MSDIHARAFTKKHGALHPSDAVADEFMATLKEGREVLVSVRRPRSPRHHRLLFGLLRKVVDNTDKWHDEKVLLDDLKLATGLFETRISALTGMPYPVPASISFASMDQTRFAAWFEKATNLLATDVLNCAPEELRAEVEAMVDRRAA
jgi:hypothetical protein